jgi:hypothetical protein
MMFEGGLVAGRGVVVVMASNNGGMRTNLRKSTVAIPTRMGIRIVTARDSLLVLVHNHHQHYISL